MRYFSKEFTKLTPEDAPFTSELSPSVQNAFKDFSYCGSPDVLFQQKKVLKRHNSRRQSKAQSPDIVAIAQQNLAAVSSSDPTPCATSQPTEDSSNELNQEADVKDKPTVDLPTRLLNDLKLQPQEEVKQLSLMKIRSTPGFSEEKKEQENEKEKSNSARGAPSVSLSELHGFMEGVDEVK